MCTAFIAMFKDPVRELVLRYMLEVAIISWINCGHKVMHVVSNNTQTGCGIQSILD